VHSRAALFLVSALSWGVLSAGASAEESWDPRLTNPNPLAGAPHWIDDRPVTLGDSDERFGYSEFVRRDHLAGSLSEARADGRFYYLGKYEVTKDQYAAVMAESCPRPKIAGRVPASGMSWFEAIEFTRKYNEWLGCPSRLNGNMPSAAARPSTRSPSASACSPWTASCATMPGSRAPAPPAAYYARSAS
jgi:hypothetical protein